MASFKQRDKPTGTEKLKGVADLHFFGALGDIGTYGISRPTLFSKYKDYKKLSRFKDAAVFDEKGCVEVGEILRNANSGLIAEYISLLVKSGQLGKAEGILTFFVDDGFGNQNADSLFRDIEGHIGPSRPFLKQLSADFRKKLMRALIRNNLAPYREMDGLFVDAVALANQPTVMEIIRETDFEEIITSRFPWDYIKLRSQRCVARGLGQRRRSRGDTFSHGVSDRQQPQKT